MTIYESNGLRADLIDNEAIAIYVEGVFCCEMTLQEWDAINTNLWGETE